MPATVTKPKVKLGNTRVTGKEQYYTPVELAAELVAQVVALVPDFANRTILEPAGGTGSFIEAARKFGATKFVSFDIEPKHESVIRGDFLKTKLGGKKTKLHGAIALSNPPFGRNNSLSIPFFNRAAEHCDVIAFIVPRSWRKWSVINRLNRNFELVHDHDLQIDYTDDGGTLISNRRLLATCFQVWRRTETLRPLIAVQDRAIVTKVKPADADVSLTVFGYGCGTVHETFERRANTTRMFLKLNHPDALKALKSVDFSKFYRNTAYTEALSLQEINYLLNEYVFGDAFLIEKS